MYPFSQSVTPAARTHLEAQLSFFNDMSKSLFRTVQQYSDLNIQLAQTMLEESTTTGQQFITANRPTEAIAAAAAHAQPAAEKLRAYQQHLSRIAANTHVDLAKVAEEHVTETSRTAKELAEEVTRMATEETEKTVRNQQDAMRRMAATFDQFADGHRAGMDDNLGNGHQAGPAPNGHERQQAEARVAGAPVHQTSQQNPAKPQTGRKEG